MDLPVRRVLRRQFRGADDQQVLGVVLLGSLREIEAARDDRCPSMTMILLWAMACFVSICTGMPTFTRKSASLYFSDFWLLSRMTCTFTPRLCAARSALAMGAEVNEYACTRTLVLAAFSSLTTASVQPPFGEKKPGWAGGWSTAGGMYPVPGRQGPGGREEGGA